MAPTREQVKSSKLNSRVVLEKEQVERAQQIGREMSSRILIHYGHLIHNK